MQQEKAKLLTVFPMEIFHVSFFLQHFSIVDAMRASSCNKSHHHACGERCSSPSGQPTQQVRTPRNPPFDSSITGGEDIGRRKEKGWPIHEKRWLHSGRYSLLDFLDCGGGKGWPVAPLLFFPPLRGENLRSRKKKEEKKMLFGCPPPRFNHLRVCRTVGAWWTALLLQFCLPPAGGGKKGVIGGW